VCRKVVPPPLPFPPRSSKSVFVALPAVPSPPVPAPRPPPPPRGERVFFTKQCPELAAWGLPSCPVRVWCLEKKVRSVCRRGGAFLFPVLLAGVPLMHRVVLLAISSLLLRLDSFRRRLGLGGPALAVAGWSAQVVWGIVEGWVQCLTAPSPLFGFFSPSVLEAVLLVWLFLRTGLM